MHKREVINKTFIFLIITLALSACGGSGGEADTNEKSIEKKKSLLSGEVISYISYFLIPKVYAYEKTMCSSTCKSIDCAHLYELDSTGKEVKICSTDIVKKRYNFEVDKNLLKGKKLLLRTSVRKGEVRESYIDYQDESIINVSKTSTATTALIRRLLRKSESPYVKNIGSFVSNYKKILISMCSNINSSNALAYIKEKYDYLSKDTTVDVIFTYQSTLNSNKAINGQELISKINEVCTIFNTPVDNENDKDPIEDSEVPPIVDLPPSADPPPEKPLLKFERKSFDFGYYYNSSYSDHDGNIFLFSKFEKNKSHQQGDQRRYNAIITKLNSNNELDTTWGSDGHLSIENRMITNNMIQHGDYYYIALRNYISTTDVKFEMYKLDSKGQILKKSSVNASAVN